MTCPVNRSKATSIGSSWSMASSSRITPRSCSISRGSRTAAAVMSAMTSAAIGASSPSTWA